MPSRETVARVVGTGETWRIERLGDDLLVELERGHNFNPSLDIEQVRALCLAFARLMPEAGITVAARPAKVLPVRRVAR